MKTMGILENDEIQDFIDGKDTESFWLHIISTPDTKILGEEVRRKIQSILDKWHKSNPKIYKKRKVTLENIETYEKFKNGESIPTLTQSVRWKHVYLLSDPHWDYWKSERSLDDKIANDKLILDTAKWNGARSVNLIQSAMPYARQDKTTPWKRQSGSFDTIGREFSYFTGSNGYIMNLDLHNPASKSAFQGTNFINFHTWWFIKRCIQDMNKEQWNIVLSGADQWWDKKVSGIAKEYWLQKIIVIKDRDYSKKNSVNTIDIYWDIEWKDILIHDDILDTWGTLCSLLEEMLKKKPKSINIAITHWQFNGEAFEKLEKIIKKSEWVIEKVYITNSINKSNLPEYVEVMHTDDIIANNIFSIFQWLPIKRDNDKNYSS